MSSKRWLAPWKDSVKRPVFYHCISRVVDRKFVFGPEEKEKFRAFMRMQENFTGCRVVAYCLMSNHLHLMLEVPPLPEDGLTDEALLERLRAIYPEGQVAEVAGELAEARQKVGDGRAQASMVAAIHARFTYRMHDLSEFMKTLMQRFTKWFNRTRSRTGNLWEDAFKSVIVEDGIAAKTMAAYIDLNPVRAGLAKDPADYRWSSYGEAMGGGAKGNGKKARAGLVRALMAHQGHAADAGLWAGKVSREYRQLLLDGAMKRHAKAVNAAGEAAVRVTRRGLKKTEREGERKQLERHGDVPLCLLLRCRVRYFTDGVVIGSRAFVNEVFTGCRERFGEKRKDGARRLRGSGAAAAGRLWSLRDLRRDIG